MQRTEPVDNVEMRRTESEGEGEAKYECEDGAKGDGDGEGVKCECRKGGLGVNLPKHLTNWFQTTSVNSIIIIIEIGLCCFCNVQHLVSVKPP